VLYNFSIFPYINKLCLDERFKLTSTKVLRLFLSLSGAAELFRQLFDKNFYVFSVAVNKHIPVFLHFVRKITFFHKFFHVFSRDIFRNLDSHPILVSGNPGDKSGSCLLFFFVFHSFWFFEFFQPLFHDFCSPLFRGEAISVPRFSVVKMAYDSTFLRYVSILEMFSICVESAFRTWIMVLAERRSFITSAGIFSPLS